MVSPRNIRLALAILVVTATIGIIVAIMQKGSSPAPPERISNQIPKNIDVDLRNASFSESRDGKVVWTLIAERAEYDKNGEMVYLNGIKMEFVRTDSVGNITVHAAKGNYSVKSRNVGLRGKVHVVTGAGAVFDTESLDYLASRSCFSTSDSVSFLQQRMALAARGMTLDVNEQVARFNNSVDATIEGLTSK